MMKKLNLPTAKFAIVNDLTKRIIANNKIKLKDSKKYNEEKKKLNQDLAMNTLSNLESMLAQMAAQNKAAAIAYKAIQIGKAIINTSAAVTLALSSFPPPINMAWASVVGAMGAAEIAMIASQGFQQGTDSVPSMLTPGEMVIPATFADAIRSGRLALATPGSFVGEGTPGGKTVNLTVNLNAAVNNEVDIEAMTEMIGENLEEKLRRV